MDCPDVERCDEIGMKIGMEETRNSNSEIQIEKKQSYRIQPFKNKRMGEKRKNNRGIEMEIVAYRGALDIDVLFETGEIVTGKEYDSFKKGEIKCPSGYSYTHVGTKRENNQGIEMEIIACSDPAHLDVRFETGEVVKNRTYAEFRSGAIRCPNVMSQKRTGEKNVNHQGLEMEIIKYRTCRDMEVQFETGDVIHTTYHEFKTGTTRCPSFYRLKRIGERKMNTQGIEMEIIEYRNNNDIDVRFSTGDIVTGRAYCNFKHGKISCPTM